MNLAWIAALIVTAISVAVGRRIAVHVGLVDKPDQRKKHVGNVPLVGGIAIYIGVLTVLLVNGRYVMHTPFLVGAFLIVATGVWDDIRGLSPYVRLFVQAGAILLLAFWDGLYIADLGNIMPDGSLLELGWFAIPFTIIAGVGLINAFNMTDGLDGLCGSLALAALAGVLAMAASVGTHHMDIRFLLVVAAAIVGFLLFNFPFPGRAQASAFLGDAGSYLLGYSVLYAIILLSQGQNRAMPPVSGLWFCLLPLLDMGGILIRRILRRRSPFNADREHLHHVFTLAKFSVTETTGAMALTALVAVLLGTNFVFQGVSEFGLFVGFLAIAAIYLWRMLRAWKRLRFFSRSIDRRVQNAAPGVLVEDRRKSVVLESANDSDYLRRSGKERRTKNAEKTQTPIIPSSVKSTDGVRAGQNG
jgi:UDP-GlcNAc:undecaprenyl-phosphate GlcNAc-1-phosphate transferase